MKKARFVQAFARAMTIVAVIGIIGSFGARETQGIAWIQAFRQAGAFAVIRMVMNSIDRIIERSIVRWRKR